MCEEAAAEAGVHAATRPGPAIPNLSTTHPTSSIAQGWSSGFAL